MQKRFLKYFWHYTKKHKLKFFLMLLIIAAAVIINSFVSRLILAEIFNHIQNKSLNKENSIHLVIIFSLSKIIGTIVLWRFSNWLNWVLCVDLSKEIFEDMFQKMPKKSANFYNNNFSGSITNNFNKFISSTIVLIDLISWSFLPLLIGIATATTILTFYFWQYAVILFVLSVSFIISTVLTSKKISEKSKISSKAYSKRTGMLSDIISNISLVKSYGKENFEYKRLEKKGLDIKEKDLNHMKQHLVNSLIYSSISSVVSITAVIAATVAANYDLISIGTIYICLTYSMSMSKQLWGSSNMVRTFNRLVGDADPMIDLLESEDIIHDNSNKKLKVSAGAIEFDKVKFTHQSGAGVKIFKNLNLEIKGGQKVGIVGKSGAGKTSLVNNLLRFADVDGGEIRIDGQNIAHVTQESLHKSIAFVPQDSMLFHRSIKDNISYGKPKATEAEIIKTAKLANAWEFIKDLPDGLDTLVGERGVKLSGGQRQRVAIARAILKNSPILILDEATSALDSQSEKLIQSSFDNLMKDRTSIVIAHRLSTIAKLDRIIVLDKGKIVEDGTHKQLLEKDGIYANLWHHQSDGFIE